MKIVLLMKHGVKVTIPDTTKEDFEIFMFHFKVWKKFLKWNDSIVIRKKDVMVIELLNE